MRQSRWFFYFSMALMLLLAACAPAATPTATQAPVASEAPATSAPAATAAVADTPTSAATEASTATTVPVDLAGPPMEVGSTFLYVDGTTLVAVPGGPFTMGHGGSDNPVHTVTLGDFWMYATKVTNLDYANCVAAKQCTPPDLQDNQGYTDYLRQSDPVVGVTYEQAAAYCTYVHGTLPTEAQWEKAARGPDANLYPWGNNAPACDLLNFNNCVGKTTSVVSYPKGQSYYKALDMEGNTYEWVADWYDPFYYKNGASQDPVGPDTGDKRSVRSGGYKSNNDQVLAFIRSFSNPTDHRRDLGFRCVVADPMYFAPACSLTMVNGLPSSGVPIPGSDSKLDCPPTPSISQGPWCQPNTQPWTPYVNVYFNNVPPGATINQGSCTGSANPYLCASDTNVSIHWSNTCTFTNPVPASCPGGYHQSGNACVPDQGWQGQCLPGQTYDPTTMCCQAAAGQNNSFGLPQVCPAGWVYNAGTQSCDQISLPPDVTAPVQVSKVNCSPPPPPGGGNNSCNLSCQSPQVLDPVKCVCR